jgi:hypothetical protein
LFGLGGHVRGVIHIAVAKLARHNADLEHVDLSRLLEYTARQLPVLLLSRVSVQAFSAAG